MTFSRSIIPAAAAVMMKQSFNLQQDVECNSFNVTGAHSQALHALLHTIKRDYLLCWMCWTGEAPGLSFINILCSAPVTPLSRPIFLAPLCSFIFHLFPPFFPPLGCFISPSLLLTQLHFVVGAGDKDTRRLQLRIAAAAKLRSHLAPAAALAVAGVN